MSPNVQYSLFQTATTTTTTTLSNSLRMESICFKEIFSFRLKERRSKTMRCYNVPGRVLMAASLVIGYLLYN